MTVQALVYNRLTADAGITTLVGTRLVGANTMGAEDGQKLDRPWVTLKYGQRFPGVSRSSFRQDLEVWAFDEMGDYTRINRILDLVTANLLNAPPVSYVQDGVTTWWFAAHWDSTSPELVDDGYRACLRYASYRLIGNTQ